MSSRIAWGVGDQALSSVTNFSLGILVARAVGPREFGAFALAFAAYLLALGTSRALTSEPLVVRYSARDEPSWREATRSATGAAMAIGGILGIGYVLLGWAVGGTVGAAFVALGLFLPGLLVQDAWRFAFFARRSGRQAFLNDLFWTMALVPGIAVVLATERASVEAFVAVWGVAATVAALAGGRQARVVPSLRCGAAWWRAHSDLAPRFLGDFLVMSGASQLVLYCVGVLAGLAAVGSLRAGQILLGPLNVLFMGVALVAVPEGVNILRSGRRNLRRAGGLVSLALVTCASAWAAVLLLIPTNFGEALLGSSWESARSVILPLTIGVIGSGAAAGGSLGLRSLGAARRTMRARLIVTPLVLLGGLGGALLSGAVGAASGLAAASWLGAFVFWRQFLLGANEHVPRTTTHPWGILAEAHGARPGLAGER